MHDLHTPPPQRPVYNTPMALDESFTRTRGLEPELAKSRNKQMVEDAKKNTVGPMPVHDFMREFLYVPHPFDRIDLLSSRRAFNRVPSRAATSEELCGYLLLALNKQTKHKSRCPGFVFDRSSSGDICSHRRLNETRPDICCYATSNLEAVKAGESPRPEFGYAELFIEVKPDPHHDFFVDPSDGDGGEPHNFFANSEDATFNKRRNRAFGQHISYVTEIFARQYRVKLFTISISGSRARFLRWDRSGCIVSESFDIREYPDVLCEFLLRFSQTTSEVRGHDPTIIAALPQEEELFRDTLRAYVAYQLGVEGVELDHAMREHYHPGSVSVVSVLAHGEVANADNLHRFLVSRPVVSPLHLTGRSTRGFWAVDASTRRVVFLKDTWRSSVETEGEVLYRLGEVGVRNIPSVSCHGDVPDRIPDTEYRFPRAEMQCSMVDEYCSDPWVSRIAGSKVIVGKYWHYRLVLSTVGYGIARIKGTEELLHAAYDVFHALNDAHEHASRLHRDISVGNVVLVREQDCHIRRGYLVDWDASCETDDVGHAIDVGRAGTWLFMSVRMQAAHAVTIKHTLQDDLESLLYVVLYCAFLYLPHNLSKEGLSETVRLFFEGARLINGRIAGGQGKLDNAISRTYIKPVQFNAPLKEWLESMMDYCYPLFRLKKGSPDPWTQLDLLDKFWGDFLQTHTLEHDDRQVHEHPHVTDEYEDHAQPGCLVSSEVISLGKRLSEEHGADGAQGSKKSRRTTAVSAPVQPPRRSERIRGQQERPPSPRVTRSAARETTKRTGVRTRPPRRGTQAARRK